VIGLQEEQRSGVVLHEEARNLFAKYHLRPVGFAERLFNGFIKGLVREIRGSGDPELLLNGAVEPRTRALLWA
jgi:hypothetical protein